MGMAIPLSVLDGVAKRPAASPVDEAGQAKPPHAPQNAMQGHIWALQGEQGDAYERRVKACFAAAYAFLDTHKHARTPEDFKRAVAGLPAYGDPLNADPLARGLFVECMNELDREFKAATGNGSG